MVHIELVQTDYSTMASHKTSCSWHRKSSTNVNMTSVCGLRAGRVVSRGTGSSAEETPKILKENNLFVSGILGRYQDRLYTVEEHFFCPWLHQEGKKGSPSWSATESPPLANALQWCAVIPVTFQAVLSLINAWQLSQDATAFNLARLVRWSLICTDKGSFATQAQQIKATLHNKYKGLYQ